MLLANIVSESSESCFTQREVKRQSYAPLDEVLANNSPMMLVDIMFTIIQDVSQTSVDQLPQQMNPSMADASPTLGETGRGRSAR